MKKSLLWVVLLGITFAFNACDKDDDPVAPIVGTWARATYEFTELPSTFQKYWEGYKETSILGEGNFIFVFNADGTYSRRFTFVTNSLNDKGKYTLDGTSLKLTPDNASDIDLIDELLIPGAEFTVSGEISDVRMTFVRVVTLNLYPDAVIDAANDSGEAPTSDQREPVDVTIIYKFDKVK